MTDNHFIHTDFYRILSAEQADAIHKASLSVLEKTGVTVQHEAGLELLAAAGASVDQANQRVKMKEELIERCLSTLPSKLILAARNPKKDLYVEHSRLPVARNGGGSDLTLDLDTDERRPLYEKDLVDYIRLMDGLEHIDFIAPVYAHDFPVATRDIRVMETLFSNTDKHVHMRAYSKQSLEFILRMASVVAGSEASLQATPDLKPLRSAHQPVNIPGGDRRCIVPLRGVWNSIGAVLYAYCRRHRTDYPGRECDRG